MSVFGQIPCAIKDTTTSAITYDIVKGVVDTVVDELSTYKYRVLIILTMRK